MKRFTGVCIILASFVLIATAAIQKPKTVYLLRVTTTFASEEVYWVIDVNGGELQAGDEIDVYFYNDAIALGASARFKAYWNPSQLNSYALAKMECDRTVFDGSVLNLAAEGAYGLQLVSSKDGATASIKSFAAGN